MILGSHYKNKRNRLKMKEHIIFKALGDKTRYSIILKLLTKNTTCTEIASFTKKDISTISRQINVLKKAGLLVIKKQNKTKCIKIKNKKLLQKIIKDIKNL